MKKILSFVFLLLCCSSVFAQQFDSYFTDATLRIDYIFAGNSKQQWIALDQLNRIPRWYGKRQHLAELPVEGNGRYRPRPSLGRDRLSQLLLHALPGVALLSGGRDDDTIL